MTTHIAVIITCFNRKDKTTDSLVHLFKACDTYNQAHPQAAIELSVYLTDDGCTDGTADAVREVCEGHDLHIIQGNGHCYWAGGMRLAWNEALKQKGKWDFYLLLNDDTMVYPEVFEELFSAHRFALDSCHKAGLYSGITCDIDNPSVITYGGEVFNGKVQADGEKISANASPMAVDQTNANILLVSKEIVDSLGIFHEGFIHGSADYDYSMQAHKHGFPVMVTAKVCGACEYDHLSGKNEVAKLGAMSLSQRIKYLKNPVHSDHDYLLYIRRNLPHKYLVSLILRKIRLYSPKLYGTICHYRRLHEYK